jgi:Flp pilus assembly protein TadG
MKMCGLSRSRRGQAVLELALILPLLLLLLFGIVESGRLGNAYLAVTHAARHGVRQGAVGASDQEIADSVRAAASPLAGTNISVQVSPTQRRTGQDITVTVNYPLRLYMPLADQIFGRNPLIVSSSLTMRVE